jgi:adenylate kinase
MTNEAFANGCILDGFPRTRAQAEALEGMLSAKGAEISKVVNIAVDDSTIIARLLQRGRADDQEEIIRHRLNVYNDETAPLLDFYGGKGLLTTIDGIGEVDDVNTRILAAIQA